MTIGSWAEFIYAG